jgi:coenzyme PQQ biosynthesis protein PqqD
MLINPDNPIKLSPLHRVQWEEALHKDVIIYPEGTVELNASSGEILKLCDGSRNLIQLIDELENKFSTTGLTKDITGFLEIAFKNGWVDQLKTETKAAPLSFSGCSTQVLKDTELHRNPFFLLSATTRDDRRRIVELADEKSLELDHEVCQKARSDLTSPRTRLGSEMSWLPGVSPKKAAQLVGHLFQNPMFIRMESGLPALAHANLMAAAFKCVGTKDDSEDLSSFIQEMAYLVDEIAVDDIIRDINEDRLIAGFSEVLVPEQVESELIERKRYFKNAIKDALNRLPPKSLVETMTLAVDSITVGGEDSAPELIDDLVDSYEVETQGFLQKEAENVHKLIKKIRDFAPSGAGAVNSLIDKLVVVASNWDNVAQPIQLSAKARGIEHELSNELAYSIRSLAIDLFNEYDMLTQSQRITSLLQELFAELPEIVERVEQDAEALQDIFQNRKLSESRSNEWAQEITYHAEIGIVFKDTLSISPEGVSWKNKKYPLNAITRVRWGGVSHSVNGIPTGTTYTIAFGDSKSETVVELKGDKVYSPFIDKLWRAVCFRLLTESLESLKVGNKIRFGGGVISDDGITLIKHKFLGSNQLIRCTWQQVNIWNSNGNCYIGAIADKKTYVESSYIHNSNTHILEQIIRMAFKNGSTMRLSDLLKES